MDLDQLGVPKPFQPILRNARVVEKIWGYEFIIVATPFYTWKGMLVKPGYQCSLHWHPAKSESFVQACGRVKLELPDINRTMEPGDQVNLHPGMEHRFSSEHGALFFEVSNFDDPKDCVRIQESKEISK